MPDRLRHTAHVFIDVVGALISLGVVLSAATAAAGLLRAAAAIGRARALLEPAAYLALGILLHTHRHDADPLATLMHAVLGVQLMALAAAQLVNNAVHAAAGDMTHSHHAPHGPMPPPGTRLLRLPAATVDVEGCNSPGGPMHATGACNSPGGPMHATGACNSPGGPMVRSAAKSGASSIPGSDGDSHGGSHGGSGGGSGGGKRPCIELLSLSRALTATAWTLPGVWLVHMSAFLYVYGMGADGSLHQLLWPADQGVDADQAVGLYLALDVLLAALIVVLAQTLGQLAAEPVEAMAGCAPAPEMNGLLQTEDEERA